MIITEEQAKEKTDMAGDAPDRHADAHAKQDHPPPPYSPGASGATPEASLPNLQATNYAHVNRKHAPIREQYVIDLSVPPLPGSSNVDESHEKPNLLLEASHGSIGVEVWVVDSREGSRTKRERARLRFSSHHGRCSAAVHEHASSPSPRPFLNMVVRAKHGSAQLTLPSSFRGKLILHTVHGRITLSEKLKNVTAVLWETNGTRVCFVGDRPAKWKNTLTNDGDELYDEGQIGEGEDVDEAWVGTRDGAVSVRFEGEREPDILPGILGSVMKIFGL